MASEETSNNQPAPLPSGGSISSALIHGVFSIVNTRATIAASKERDEKQRDFERELEKVRRKNQENFEQKQFERQKLLQEELATYNRETILIQAAEQRKTALSSVEANKLFENWPLRIVPSLILNSYHREDFIPLRIIPVPPIVDFDKFGSTVDNFPKIEKYLAEGLRQFLTKHYSLNNPIRPVEFLDGAWDSNRYHGGSSIKALFEMLKSEPILILESEIDGDYLNFRIGYWGLGQINYSYKSVISRLPYRKMIDESAKTRAKNWKPVRESLQALGKDAKEINEVDTYNLEILEEEESLKQAGIDISKLPHRYKLKNEDFEAFSQFLVTCNCLVAGWVADMHHLIQSNVTPLLPQLLPELAQDFQQQPVIQAIVSGYQEIYETLERERLEVLPAMFLELANSLKALPDKSLVKEQVDYSIKSWLKLRGIKNWEKSLLIESMESVFMSQDFDYAEQLRQLLGEIGDIEKANELGAIAYYQKALAHSQSKLYDSVISDCNQVIQLNPNFANKANQLAAIAYYQRARTHERNKFYDKVISDCSKAIELKSNYVEAKKLQAQAYYQQGKSEYKKGLEKFQLCENISQNHWSLAVKKYDKAIKNVPDFADAWCDRGLALFKLSQIEDAIASFDKVIEINSNLADAWYNRGVVLQEMGRSDEAKADFEQARKLKEAKTNSQQTLKPTRKNNIAINKKVKVELLSERGVDYTQLSNLLASKNWREADQETKRVMLETANRLGKDPSGGNAQNSWFKNIPCTDLRTIDRLWVAYSNGRFGFSVQKNIWLTSGKKQETFEIEMQLAYELGWLRNGPYAPNVLNYSINAPIGHLPVANIGNIGHGMISSYVHYWHKWGGEYHLWFLGEFFALWQRLIECGIY